MHQLFSLATLLSLACLAPSSAWATDAPVVDNNPQGVLYVANITTNGLSGSIVATTPTDGLPGVAFQFSISGGAYLDSSNYLYHIHQYTVPADGNCTGTGAHLDPYGRGETPACNMQNPSSCQVGDLSGKHGTIPTLEGFSTSYDDEYLSLTPGTPAFLGNRSLVLHYPNLTRIACANFYRIENSGTASNGTTSNGTFLPSQIQSTSAGQLPTFTSTTAGAGSTSSSGSIPSSAAAKKSVSQSHAVILGPLLLGLAAAVW